MVREAKPEEYWEASDVHCAAFYPSAPLPMAFILRSDRVSAILGNLCMPRGTKKKCLIAVELSSQKASRGSKGAAEAFDGEKDIFGGPILRPLVAAFQLGPPILSWTLSGLNVGPFGIVGSVTVDTAGEFLPRRNPGMHRRRGIAYVSNMAVRAVRRRRGVAHRLLLEAESFARKWGCRSMALHCDSLNEGAINLYLKEGFRIVKMPNGATWPQPMVGPGQELVLMMKRL